MKFGKKSARAVADSREQTADTLFADLGIVTFVAEGSDLIITEDNFVPSARCIQDTKKGQLVTRSSLQRLRGCVCHLHHERAMKVPIVFDNFSQMYPRKYNTTGLMLLLEMPMRQHTSTTRGKNTKTETIPQLPPC